MPWIIIVYDVNEKKVNKMRKICEPYIKRVQRSVFEGQISVSGLRILIDSIKNFIDEEKDSVRIYEFREDRRGKLIELGNQIKNTNIL
jgi:CRISPR-associated protein Cas2